ncbi:hypothetical protein D3C87_1253520 [compost metagenome]
MRTDRIVHRCLYRSHCRQMYDGVAIAHGLGHGGAVCDIADNQVQIGVVHGQITDFAGGQVIQHADFIPLGQQRFHKVRSNESGSASDQYALNEHEISS